MNTKYQIVIIGHSNSFQNEIIEIFNKRVSDLGISLDSIIFLNENNYQSNYIGNAPTVGLYFGGVDNNYPHIDILDRLIFDSNLILPIVDDLKFYLERIPENLRPINGIELKSNAGIESIVGRMLEGLSLLRLARRLFISYKRTESTGVAIQLFEKLEQAGFDVFLDTHSIQKGEVFQEELWHRMVDTDVVVLLNTKGFLESDWTQQELAKASAMSIGILQVIWPDHNPEPSSGLSIQLTLTSDDFQNNDISSNSRLIDNSISQIINMTEALRARSLGARQDNIITEFIKTATAENVKVNLQSQKILTLTKTNGSEIVVIPTIGVPHAFTYYQSQDLVKTIRVHKPESIFLLFDHINIREKWLKHLDWLNDHLPIQTIRILDSDKWLKTI